MYWRFDEQMRDALLRRDAFLDRVIAGEIAHIDADLAGKRMSPEAHRYVAGCLKQMGGGDAGELWPVSISVQHATAHELRRVTMEHNLVRDALINRMVMLLRAADKLLNNLDLPLRVDAVRLGGAEDMATSPLKAIEEVQYDPFYYLRTACEQRHGCGLYTMSLPKALDGFACYLADDEIPKSAALAAPVAREKADASEFDSFLAEWMTLRPVIIRCSVMTKALHTSDARCFKRLWLGLGGSILCVRRTGEVRYAHPHFTDSVRANDRRKDVPAVLLSRANQMMRWEAMQAAEGNGHHACQ